MGVVENPLLTFLEELVIGISKPDLHMASLERL